MKSKRLHIRGSVTLKASAAGSDRRFRIEAYDGGKLTVATFDLPVVLDLAGGEIPESVPILIDHEKTVEATLGSTDHIVNDGFSLVEEGVVTATSPKAMQVIAQHDAGQQWQSSVGTIIPLEAVEELGPGETAHVNGRTHSGPCYIARRWALKETSVLPMGAATRTTVNLAAAAAALNTLKGAPAMSFEEWVQSLGIDPATLTEENRAALMLSYDALTNATPQTPAAPSAPVVPVAAESGTPPDPDKEKEMQAAAIVSAMNKAAAENKRRVAQIELLAAGHPAIAATAIEKGWSLVETENAVLKANAARTRPTSFRSAEKEFPQEQVLEAAVCMVRKTKNIEKDFKPEILQAAHSEFRGRVGLKQIMMIAACANGYHARPGEGVTMGNFSELLRYACPDPRFLHLQAASAFSTVSLPGIMSNVANKELLTGYMEEDAVWREICQIKSVSDFKQVTSYRMLDDMEFEELSPGGTIKQGKIGEESYTRQARTYAKMFTLERTQIINDDLGALDDLRSRLGRGYAKRLNKIFWTAFINNSTFFTTARTNYISGATSNLGDDGVGLGLGVTAFRKMTSPTGDGAKRVGAGLRPEILLVPPELEAVAERMYRNQNLGAGTKNSEANIYANKYRPLVAWQLSDSEYTGNSTTAWYLLSSPSGYPTIVVSFLDGVETPTVESADADFNTLGIQFRGYHDFGCDMAEYLGGLKSKGAS